MTENIAIIDLGTNTFHLLIAEIDDRDAYVIKGKYKEPVQLGEGGINSGKIEEAPFKRGIRALKTFRTIIDSASVTKTFAYATSAIRSAENGPDFIKAAKQEAGIEIKIINGNEEAALIYEGVNNGVHLPFDEQVLLMDIGGGSVEFIVAHEGRAELLRSINIGGARLLERIKPSNPITVKEIQALYKLFDKELSGLMAELKEFNLSLMIGSSGTCETIATLAAHQKKDKISALNINGYRLDVQDFLTVFQKLLTSTKIERLKMEGMDPMRSEMIVVGACLVNYMFTELSLPQMLVSSQALKEGILHRYMREKKMRLVKFIGSADRSLRVKSVQGLAKKFLYEEEHVLRVSEISTQLFDELEPYHHLGAAEKELLQYAAVLHDIGKYIHVNSHHKHGQYIVANSNLAGFNTTELLVLSNIVRYHRRTLPKIEHAHYGVLNAKDKRVVNILAGILRIADNLDRGHRNFVQSVKATVSPDKIFILVNATQEVEMEVSNARNAADLLELAMGRSVEIKCDKG